MVKVGYSRLVNAGPVAGHPAWIPVSWTFPHPLPPCVRVSDYLLLQSLHLAQEALELLLASLQNLRALRGPLLGTVHALLSWESRAPLQ